MNEAPTWRWTITITSKKKKKKKKSSQVIMWKKTSWTTTKKRNVNESIHLKKKKKKKSVKAHANVCEALGYSTTCSSKRVGRLHRFFHLSFVAVPPHFVRCCFFFLLLTSLTCDDWVLVRIRVPPCTPGRRHHQTSCCQPFAKTALDSTSAFWCAEQTEEQTNN